MPKFLLSSLCAFAFAALGNATPLAHSDSIPPTITCPAPLTVTLTPTRCDTVLQYEVAFSDDQPDATLSQTTGIPSGSPFPIGTTLNTFVATDTSGNTASCAFSVQVINYDFGLSCEQGAIFELPDSCAGIPSLNTLLITAYGCPSAYLVEFDDSAPYGNGPWVFRALGADDLGKTYATRVTVDANQNGMYDVNEERCTGNVSIRDETPPTMGCQDFSVPCYINDFEAEYLSVVVGIAAATPPITDACGALDEVYYIDNEQYFNCTENPGTSRIIRRTWFATDANNNSGTCLQQISVTRTVLADLYLPADTSVECSNPTSAEATGRPFYSFLGKIYPLVNGLCELDATHTDSMAVGTPICDDRRLLRTWSYINWCSGLVTEQVQTIHLRDSLPPTMACPADLIVGVPAENCQGPLVLPSVALSDACSPLATLQAWWLQDSVSVMAPGILSADSAGFVGSFDTIENVTVGRVLDVTYLLTDSCGNEAQCHFKVAVANAVVPEVICSTVFMTAMPGGIRAYATDLATVSEDTCGFAVEYRIRRANDANGDFAPFVVITCDEVGDIIPIALRVYNIPVPGDTIGENYGIGHFSECEASVIVSINTTFCMPPPEIGGLITTETGAGIEHVIVWLNGTHPALPPLNSGNEGTDENGHYSFGAIPVASNYTVVPEKDDAPLNGVTTQDLILISRHILGTQPFDTPYKMIAADANKSGSITSFDIVELRKLILEIYGQLPNNTVWRFVDASYVFPNPQNPFQPPFPEKRTIASGPSDLDFIGVKVGDVNLSAITIEDSLLAAEERTERVFYFETENRSVRAAETFEVGIRAAEWAEGCQFTLNTDGLEILEVQAGEAMRAEHFALFPQKNALTAAWETGGLADFRLKVRAQKAGELHEMLSISSQITPAEAYLPEGNDGSMAKASIALRFGTPAQGFELFQNQPNPFADATTIGFWLPESSDATLTIFDGSGRTLFSQSGYYARGSHSIQIEKADFQSVEGVLYYRLQTAKQSAVRRMTRLD
jgi:hypothetical protein